MVALSDALAALTSWQRRAREALAVATPLATLQALAAEAHSLPAAVQPEQAAVQVWSVNQTCSNQRTHCF